MRPEMKTRGYAVEITNLSPNATEKDVRDFLAFCGSIQHVELVRAGDSACIAYVTFKNPHAAETAVLLSGDTVLDQPVRITQWGHCDDEYNVHNSSSWKIEDDSNLSPERHKAAPSAGKAVSFAQDTVKAVAAKGFVLGKDAVVRAKAYGQSHQVPAAAIAKASQLSQGIGLTDKVTAGIEAAKSVDQRYHISGTTRSAAYVTQRAAASAANAVVSSSYFSKGALWLSGALDRASQVAADLGNRGAGKDS
ncbi:binding partner of ACD11 1-like isoform X1 [Salvia miltiorrhiza]|uniref:binding partner of ACD11 1-like isoform X1 n=1 Tax=Salvia miltiorrhiza TaxID=226208 RepID=UPI0025AD450D|nr:binding partner of ACD11 1-like isoform X1 [Salvia miltiorrhiza]XP_057810868.1 binding partner of ACD11 1-like isoform X1 [Salvia miltiorrhiza]XP_057810869.1 binding partner of ACD11 1-like isoform X1 [Salvia miltiorrhiza]XP_057810870.1 binding partner of ACD11 1-like isoform X1 [Salvia miltiorrhiza]XP_057810871.1 binding partner of ACD11 1-like isoform X1 [Salvia miltiorrhiza]XP_057810872.1 binding partner of ACD11 1-like isoform X1 [Salvia miltiorrhiza]XP_057810873.1 binding partner of A